MVFRDRWLFRGAALALLGLGWIAVRWSERGADGDAPSRPAPLPPEETEALPRHAAVSAGGAERVAAAPEEVAAEPASSAGSPARAAATEGGKRPPGAAEVALAGTLVVVDSGGAEHPRASGSMALVVWEGKSGRNERVEVSAGRWTAAVPAGAELAFEQLELEGRVALVDGERRIPIPASRAVEVRAHWPPASSLRVRSAETHQDLAGIELALHREMGFGFPVAEHPGAEPKVIAEEAASPIDLGLVLAGREVARGLWLYARSAGFAWGLIKIDLEAGGERILDLVPGGSLQVSVAGEVPRGAKLRLRRDGGASPRPLEIAVGRRLEHAFTSLVPGTYTASVEVGEWYEDSLQLGSGQAQVVAGSAAQISILVAPPPEAATAPLRGTLVVDPAWGAVEPALVIESVGRPAGGRRIEKRLTHRELEAAGASAWTFDAGSVPHGDYEIRIDPFCLLLQRVDASTGDLWIEIPAPATAVVRVIDGEGLEVPELATLGWSPVRADEARVGAFASVPRDPATGRFEIRAPPGRIAVFVHKRELEGDAIFDVAPGRHELDLVVKWSMGFSLAFREGETAIPLGADWMSAPPELTGAGQLSGLSAGDGTLWLHVSSPGLYRFTPAPIEGYAPIPEQEVLVPERGFAEHVVQLVRSP